MIIGPNLFATSPAQYIDVLETIISETHQKAPTNIFSNDVSFTKGAMDYEFFYEVPYLDKRDFGGYNGFLTSLAAGPFGPNYVYVA